MADEEQKLRALSAAAALLEPDGRLVFDVFAPSEEDIEETDGLWLEREPGIFERADWDARERTLTLSVRSHEHAATMELHWLSAPEWHHLVEQAGLEVVDLYGWFDRRPVRRRRGPDLGLRALLRVRRDEARAYSELDRVAHAHDARLEHLRVDAEAGLAVDRAARVEQLAEDVPVATPGIRARRGNRAARRRNADEQRRLAGPHPAIAPPLLLERVEPVELEQHPEAAPVAVDQADRRARDERRRARVGRPGAVVSLDERQRAADEIGQRVCPRALDRVSS